MRAQHSITSIAPIAAELDLWAVYAYEGDGGEIVVAAEVVPVVGLAMVDDGARVEAEYLVHHDEYRAPVCLSEYELECSNRHPAAVVPRGTRPTDEQLDSAGRLVVDDVQRQRARRAARDAA